MRDLIEISSPNERVLIDPNGAWVTSLTRGDTPIFFPKAELTHESGTDKIRGGMHVCLPNFGPGGESDLAQHGFGRTETWTVLQQNESSVTLELKVMKRNYTGLDARLHYEITGTSLTATLSLSNNGTTPFRVAPGFHPYFALEPSEAAVTVNGELLQLDKLAGTEYREAESAELITGSQHIVMHTENLTTWAIWTDQLGNYVCVEPTFGGNRFLEAARSDEALAPGQTRTYSVRIHW